MKAACFELLASEAQLGSRADAGFFDRTQRSPCAQHGDLPHLANNRSMTASWQSTNQPTTRPWGVAPPWTRRWLLAAGLYNLVWGAVVILLPDLIFELAGIEPLNHPQIWQCVGMIVGVYGVGYLIAARDSRMHWPIVVVGLLGKLLGPAGFVSALATGALPLAFGMTLLTNDLIWWIPFTMILWDAARSRRELHASAASSRDALDRADGAAMAASPAPALQVRTAVKRDEA